MRETRWIITAVVLVTFTSALALYLFFHERQRQLEVSNAPQDLPDAQTAVLEGQRIGETVISIYLYNPGRLPSDPDFLQPLEISIFRTEDPALMARQILLEVLTPREVASSETQDASAPPLRSASTAGASRLREFYLLEDGTAVVDLSREGVQSAGTGVVSELVFVESITRSLRANLPQVKRVRFLVEGKEQPTLAGHILLTRPFR